MKQPHQYSPLNAPRRNKKRAKPSPLPVIVQPESVPRRSTRRNGRSHIAAAQAARSRREESDRKSPRKRNTRSHTTAAHLLGDKERIEETGDNNLQAIDQQESTLDDDDYDDQCGKHEKGTASSVATSKRSLKSFDERFEALTEFKDAFGHCDAPKTKSSEYYSLGYWYHNLRNSYMLIRKGETPHHKLNHIRGLEAAGFKWSLVASPRIFDVRLEELVKFKQKFGHCNAPQTKAGGY